jgi:membrane protease subunit HflC
MKQAVHFFLVGLIVLSTMVIYDGFYILNEGTQAVITQFGAPVGQPVTQAGLHFKVPFMQQVNLFDKRIEIWDGDPNQIPTNDKTYIFVNVTARWRIADPLKFMQAVKTINRGQSMLDDIVDGTVRDVVNKNDLMEIIRSSDWSEKYMSRTTDNIGTKPERGRDKLTEQILEAAAKLTPQYGIELIDVMFKRVNYIDSVQQKVYDRMISEQKRIAAEKRSYGEGQKAEILGKVERELKEILSNANKESLIIRGKADAQATKIYAQAYSQDPDFFSFEKTMEGYKSMIGRNTSLVLTSDSDLYQYLKSASGKK